MNFDFSLMLVVLTLISGVIWGLDAWFFRARRNWVPREMHLVRQDLLARGTPVSDAEWEDPSSRPGSPEGPGSARRAR